MKKKVVKVIVLLFVVGAVVAGIVGYSFYAKVKTSNVQLEDEKSVSIYIPANSNYSTVKELLDPYLKDKESFDWVAKQKNYPAKIRSGRYVITHGMSNNTLVNKLRSGKQDPVRLVFNKVRTKEVFVGIIASQIEADSLELLQLLNDEAFLKGYNKNIHTAMTLFIPNTYEFYWNTDAEKFIDRMNTESKRFWNEGRVNRAKRIGLEPNEVYILASIVEEETINTDELPKVAGLYINRINRGMRLQADPTVRFALGDFEIRRVLNKHLEIDSPYNTYRVDGLPPGPICLPSVRTIDATLNYTKHNYLYFCAKADFSGYHAFAKTLSQHNANARKYHRELNRNRIFR